MKEEAEVCGVLTIQEELIFLRLALLDFTEIGYSSLCCGTRFVVVAWNPALSIPEAVSV